ncbi:hypothetical protein [Vibrio coralliilyticus]|uniref:Iron-containing alcohol dehydrogenase n=1 Tax=Vibrio coralliilyticus TaxID=190893 RepID=A0AAP6ZV67_9VIBR|nr:hypothetical protein [Vibrio coralliilyticus]NOI32017.1 iron-containing alcohol dehydrogenase [Vibrio coralliilyticus]NOJ25218.1 iron-containing alcohol dehydrogenase [Vibrio coralliilyticus]
MNNKTEKAYDFIDELRNMMGSREVGYGLTNEQLDKLAENSRVSVSEFQDCFFLALQKLAG